MPFYVLGILSHTLWLTFIVLLFPVALMMLLAQPTRKLVTVEQVADMVIYLCDEKASAITGAVLSFDGGWTAK